MLHGVTTCITECNCTYAGTSSPDVVTIRGAIIDPVKKIVSNIMTSIERVWRLEFHFGRLRLLTSYRAGPLFPSGVVSSLYITRMYTYYVAKRGLQYLPG